MKTMPSLEITRVQADHPHLHSLIALLDEDLMNRYPPEEVFTIDFSDPAVKLITFVVAYLDGTPVGCGGLRPLDRESVELKRFYVRQDYRGRGIASSMLHDLEAEASSRGFAAVRLETGLEQPEAVALYRKFGYREIPPFGEYADCPSSLCMEKQLAVSPAQG